MDRREDEGEATCSPEAQGLPQEASPTPARTPPRGSRAGFISGQAGLSPRYSGTGDKAWRRGSVPLVRPQRQASEHHRPGGPARLSLPYRGAGGGPERGRDLRRVTQRVGAPTPLPANPRPFLFLLGMREGAGSPSLGPALGKSSVNPTEGWSPSLEGLPGSVQWIELPPHPLDHPRGWSQAWGPGEVSGLLAGCSHGHASPPSGSLLNPVLGLQLLSLPGSPQVSADAMPPPVSPPEASVTALSRCRVRVGSAVRQGLALTVSCLAGTCHRA